MQFHEKEPDQEEITLFGGDVTDGIVRKGNTVRRPIGPHSPAVHRILSHLETVGFSGSPRYLGIDASGREVLSFIDGEVADRPLPKWIAEEDRAISVAKLVRALDDAMLAMGLPIDLDSNEDPPGAPPAIGPPASFWGHRDITPENIVFRKERAFALIDFDLAQPSSRVDEVCNMLLWWAPLRPPIDREPFMRELDVMTRVKHLVDAYDLDAADREHVTPVAIRSAERSWHFMKMRAERDGGGWQRMWDEGAGERILRRKNWLDENAEALHQSVTGTD